LSASRRPPTSNELARPLPPPRHAADARRARRFGLTSCLGLSLAACGSDSTWLEPADDSLSVTRVALSPASALALSDVASVPAPILRGRGGVGELILPGAASPAVVRLLTSDRALLTMLAADPRGNRVQDDPALSSARAVLVQIEAGSQALSLPESDLFLSDPLGEEHEIYLPELELAPGGSAELWVARDGSTYTAVPGATVPAFSALRRARVPWWSAPDVRVTQVAAGLTQPSGIAVVPAPGPSAAAPLLYVAEREGRVLVLRRDGALTTYAEGLLNFDPSAEPATPELGLNGIAVDPASGDVFVTLVYSDDPLIPDAPRYAAVERLTSADGGLSAALRARIKSLAPEPEGTARSLSFITFGPDDLLYVHAGDAGQPAQAQDLERYHGKILRLTRDGAPSPNNPYYNAQDGISARDFVYASGLRDAPGSAFRLDDDTHYFVEPGPDRDRLARLLVGKNYGWNGESAALGEGALYSASPSVQPTSIGFVQGAWLAGSGFAPEYDGRAYVTQSAGSGTGDASHKAITEWQIRGDGTLEDGPRTVAFYRGSGGATPAALTAGADGLYFTDLVAEDPGDPESDGAHLLRLGPAPLSTTPDCNENGVADALDLELGTSLDCNDQGIPDECDIAAGRSADCDADQAPDECAVSAPHAYDFSSEGSDFVLNGAEIADGVLRLVPEPDATASALHAPTGRLPLQRFQVDFSFRITGASAHGLVFAVFDADTYPDTQTFGQEGLGADSLEIAVDTLADDGERENALLVRFDGQLLGRYVPSFELDDDQPHRVRVAFDGRNLSLALVAAAGREVAFQALEVPGYTPFVARFGFGASGREGAPPVAIDDVVFWLPTAADANGNRVPDSCECPADVADGSESGAPDGAVTEADLRYFLTLYRAGSSAADIDDGSESATPDGAVTIEDLRYFIGRYNAGC
jgi:glucose/arabinose dehydrogenase